jgi:hypothetical protein
LQGLTLYLKSCEIRPRVALPKGLFSTIRRGIGCRFLSKAGGGRKRKASGGNRRSRTDEHQGEGGPDEAVAFIAETVAELARLARRHELEILSHLLDMVQLEAEERQRLRSKRRLS